MRGPGRLDVKEVPINALERAVRNPYNLRVGATNDPLARARQYEQGIRGHVVVGQFIYSRVRICICTSTCACTRDKLTASWLTNRYGTHVERRTTC